MTPFDPLAMFEASPRTTGKTSAQGADFPLK